MEKKKFTPIMDRPAVASFYDQLMEQTGAVDRVEENLRKLLRDYDPEKHLNLKNLKKSGHSNAEDLNELKMFDACVELRDRMNGELFAAHRELTGTQEKFDRARKDAAEALRSELCAHYGEKLETLIQNANEMLEIAGVMEEMVRFEQSQFGSQNAGSLNSICYFGFPQFMDGWIGMWKRFHDEVYCRPQKPAVVVNA